MGYYASIERPGVKDSLASSKGSNFDLQNLKKK